jgi:hypothetical protein
MQRHEINPVITLQRLNPYTVSRHPDESTGDSVMNKVLVTTIGVVLATGAVSAWAGKEDRQQLAECKAEIVEHFGEGTRTRLRSIQRGRDGTAMRILVRPADGENEVVVCTEEGDGRYRLTDREGIALVQPAAAEERVSLAQ